MADRYGVPVPVLKRMGITLRDMVEFIEWERENPATQWWAEMAARVQGVKFDRTVKINSEEENDFDAWAAMIKRAKGEK
jgi:hypothetical protein